MKLCKLKFTAIIAISCITGGVIIAMAFLSGFGAVEAGIDIAAVTLGINGIVQVLKTNLGDKNDSN